MDSYVGGLAPQCDSTGEKGTFEKWDQVEDVYMEEGTVLSEEIKLVLKAEWFSGFLSDDMTILFSHAFPSQCNLL